MLSIGVFMKATTSITLDVKVLSQAKDNIANLSRFCEDAIATHLNIIKKAEKDKIPKDKLAEMTIVEQHDKIRQLEKENKELRKKANQSKLVSRLVIK